MNPVIKLQIESIDTALSALQEGWKINLAPQPIINCLMKLQAERRRLLSADKAAKELAEYIAHTKSEKCDFTLDDLTK